LRIRERVRETYAATGSGAGASSTHHHSNQAAKAEQGDEAGTSGVEGDEPEPGPSGTGGFLLGADDVVQHFNLPRSHFQNDDDSVEMGESTSLSLSSRVPHPMSSSVFARKQTAVAREDGDGGETKSYSRTTTFEVMDLDPEEQTYPSLAVSQNMRDASSNGLKSMRELAEEAEEARRAEATSGDEVELLEVAVPEKEPESAASGRVTRRRNGANTHAKTKAEPRSKGQAASKKGKGKGRRKRKRDESEDEAEETLDGSEDEGYDGDGSSPVKKRRTAGRTAAADVVKGVSVNEDVSAGTGRGGGRTLRPRTGRKSYVQENSEDEGADE
jgi:hypothetical protein